MHDYKLIIRFVLLAQASAGDLTVKVALRIRPLVPDEVAQACGQCIEVIQDQPQVFILSLNQNLSAHKGSVIAPTES
jgi:hypothetical protein